MEEFVKLLGGDFFIALGAATAFFLASIGSSKGVGLAGQAAAGVITEDPKKFVPAMILEILPSTQAIYGLAIAFMIINGFPAENLGEGLKLFVAGLPVGIAGLISGIYQGKVAAANINMIAKRPDGLARGIVLTVMVEVMAIFGFLISIMLTR